MMILLVVVIWGVSLSEVFLLLLNSVMLILLRLVVVEFLMVIVFLVYGRVVYVEWDDVRNLMLFSGKFCLVRRVFMILLI